MRPLRPSELQKDVSAAPEEAVMTSNSFAGTVLMLPLAVSS